MAVFRVLEVFLFAAFAASLGCGNSSSPTAAQTGKAPGAAPVEGAPRDAVRLQLLDFAGIQKLIDSHRGKVVVLDCWSTSCAPCLREFPKLVALHQRYGPDRLACVSVSFDYEGIGQPIDAQPRVLQFLTRMQATFDNVLSTDEADVLFRKFDIPSIPAVFVYDRDGKLAQRFDSRTAQQSGRPFAYEQVAELVSGLVQKQ